MRSIRSWPRPDKPKPKPPRRKTSPRRKRTSGSCKRRKRASRRPLELPPEPYPDGDPGVSPEARDGPESGTDLQEEAAPGDPEATSGDTTEAALTDQEEAASPARELTTTT